MMKKQMEHVRKAKRRMISLILVITLVITGLNLDMMSDSIYATQKNKEENKKTEQQKEVTVVKELAGERTENTNTYLMSDGSKKLEIYGENIRYKEKGRWRDYDNTLNDIQGTDEKKLSAVSKKTDGIDAERYTYVNNQGDSKQYFAEVLDEEHPIVMSRDEHVIRFAPIEEKAQNKDEKTAIRKKAADTATVRGRENNLSADKKEMCASLEKDKDGDNTNKVTYSDDTQSIKYVYTSLNNGVKEEIILNKKPEKNTFIFQYDAEGTEAVEYDGNQILLADQKEGNIIASISAPYVTDAEGTRSYEDVHMELEKNEDGSYLIKLIVEEDYLEDENNYPVTIDPTVYWNGNNGLNINTIGDKTQGYSAMPGSYRFFVGMDDGGHEQITYIQLPSVIEQVKGKNIHYAVFEPVIYDIIGNPVIQIKNVESSCDFMTLYKGGKPKLSQKTYGVYSCNNDIRGDRIALYMTDIIRAAAVGGLTTYGIALKGENIKKGNTMTFYGPAEGDNKPLFYIGYSESTDVNATYDGSFSVSGSGQDKSSISLEWEEYDDTDVYQIYARENEGAFKPVGITYGTEYTYTCVSGLQKVDFRVLAIRKNGDQDIVNGEEDVLSNIISFDKVEETSKDENEKDVTTVSYEQVTRDTDGDGLEDGYEIWDFKTFWNKVTGVDAEGNKKYDLDTDKDGFPDGYEVFILGTDPKVANPKYDKNGKAVDSDGDGVSDIAEYENGYDEEHPEKVGTDPHLWDSDFDGVKDGDDFETTNPRKTDNPNIKGTDRTGAYGTQVFKGVYDREYTETEDGVSTTYITNIYSGLVKSIYTDYGDNTKNKKVKYFYDEYGNNTAIIEENPQTSRNTICITYTYDKDGNVIFICDQSTKYEMSYQDGELTEVKVGNQSLVSYENHTTEIEETSNQEEERKKKSISENITIYGKNSDGQEDEQSQKVRTVTTEYQENDGSDSEIIQKTEVYYDDTLAYVTEMNSEGKILKFTDKTKDDEVTYTYAYTDNTTKVVRNDGFTKEVITEDEEDGKSKITTSYTFKDLKGKNTAYTSIAETDTTDEENAKATMTLYNKDIVTSTASNEGKDNVTKLYSELYKKNILTSTTKEISSTSTTLNLDLYAEDKDIDYTYDKAGNITEIKINGEKAYTYTYDVHGRLTQEMDYMNKTGWEYGYSNTGNMEAKHRKKITDNGTIENVESIRYTYGNGEWPDQLTKYDGKSITYDRVGNPLSYLGKMEFKWSRGRQLSEMTLGKDTEEREDDRVITYEYNENGLRTSKVVKDTSGMTPVVISTTEYEWDNTKLIREQVTYNAIGKKYDIWYLYDSGNDVVGFEYSQLSDMNNSLQKTRIYYEKNLQGDVIGMLDSRGAEIATYQYDAWGNVVNSLCYEGNETPYALNHITYRSYYQDDETGFYYLQSRYYDAEVGRFLNADDVNLLDVSVSSAFKDNLYIYCNGNPVNYVDPEGNKAIDISKSLLSLMMSNALYLYIIAKGYKWLGMVGKIALLNKFYNLVKTNGKWDLKNQSKWKLKRGDYYKFFGSRFGVEDVGNIHFGYVASVLFSWRTMCTGAGIYQIYSGTSKWKYWYSFFDDPRDTYCISIGRLYWKITFRGRSVFQW